MVLANRRYLKHSQAYKTATVTVSHQFHKHSKILMGSPGKNLSVVLTEKLPPSNSNRFELIALGRQPHTN
jgi:hypothetical protein